MGFTSSGKTLKRMKHQRNWPLDPKGEVNCDVVSWHMKGMLKKHRLIDSWLTASQQNRDLSNHNHKELKSASYLKDLKKP